MCEFYPLNASDTHTHTTAGQSKAEARTQTQSEMQENCKVSNKFSPGRPKNEKIWIIQQDQEPSRTPSLNLRLLMTYFTPSPLKRSMTSQVSIWKGSCPGRGRLFVSLLWNNVKWHRSHLLDLRFKKGHRLDRFPQEMEWRYVCSIWSRQTNKPRKTHRSPVF